VIEDVVKEVINKKPTIEKKIREAGAGFSIFTFSGSIKAFYGGNYSCNRTGLGK
jgi:hypothetical protein